MNILEEIVAHKKLEVSRAVKLVEVDTLKAHAAERGTAPEFASALRATPMGLIAEVKRKSPSAGEIREPFVAAEIASAYAEAGAQAISVLMDGKYFGGGESKFREVREAVELPLLYKEFVVDPWQVWHAASIGASAVLLIAAVLGDDAIRSLAATCKEAGVEPLLEVHDASEMERALRQDIACIGINNRDLKSFEVSLDTTARLAAMVSEHHLLVSESGIRSREDVAAVKASGAGAVLVGEYLLTQEDLTKAVKDLMRDVWEPS